VREALVAILEGAGTTAGDRIYPMVAPEGVEMPYVVYSCGRTPDHQASGETDHDEWNIVVRGVAATFPASKTLGDQIDAALVDYSDTIESTVIRHIKLVDDEDLHFPAQDASETGDRYARVLIFNAYTKGA